MEFQKVRQVQTLILFTLLCSGYKCDIDVWQGEWSHERWRFICHCNCVVFVFTIIWVDTSWNLPLDWRKQLPYLPVYNAHPCIMCTPILKPVFRKKVFQHYSCWKIIIWKNSAEMSNLALPAWKSVTGVDANHLMFCLFSDTSSFTWRFLCFLLLFCCCTIERDPFKQCLEKFFEWGVLELDLLPHDKIQDGAAKKICMIFSLSSLSAFVQKTKK